MDAKQTQLTGREVILREDCCKGTLEERRVKVTGGFGSAPHARGRALFVTFVSDGEVSRWDRDDIDWDATNEFWKENPQ